MNPIIDLHSHTTCSDGQYTPLQVLNKAIQAGVNYLGITDHETFHSYFYILQHIDELKKLLNNVKDFTYIPGAEISVVSEVNKGKHHLCVYFPQLCITSKNVQNYVPNPDFYEKIKKAEDEMQSIREARIKRAGEILNNLQKNFGLSQLSLEEFCQLNKINMETLASESVVGRPMLAKYLVEKGVCQSVKEAFNTFLSDKSPAVVPVPPVSLTKRIEMYKKFGAITVIAHPFLWGREMNILKKELEQAVSTGLDGIEKYHWQQGLLNAEKLAIIDPKLTVSIASDFHGEQVVTGVELGNLPMNKIMTGQEKQNLLKLFGLEN